MVLNSRDFAISGLAVRLEMVSRFSLSSSSASLVCWWNGGLDDGGGGFPSNTPFESRASEMGRRDGESGWPISKLTTPDVRVEAMLVTILARLLLVRSAKGTGGADWIELRLPTVAQQSTTNALLHSFSANCSGPYSRRHCWGGDGTASVARDACSGDWTFAAGAGAVANAPAGPLERCIDPRES